MTDGIIIVILVLVVGLAAWKTVQKSRRGGGCCGSREPKQKKVPVRDRRKANYPYKVMLQISGMSCENCARKVENALNALDGVWATVRIGDRRASVLLKQEPDEAALRQAVRDAGYVVTGFEIGK